MPFLKNCGSVITFLSGMFSTTPYATRVRMSTKHSIMA